MHERVLFKKHRSRFSISALQTESFIYLAQFSAFPQKYLEYDHKIKWLYHHTYLNNRVQRAKIIT